ncbi:amidase family protein [Parasphingopyxis marina]|uniref:Amidase n=1 Tax=Parasphingopyxis marina TaxID=2761622 RepID=A0A842HSH9_9SPHN|nr:amidase family protein [Parasphingopyxis marina]MBC2776798.1 amidase [Parasphingopyxis marina]
MLEVSEAGAIETARRIAKGESSALAECEAAIARIEERDPPINAVVVRDFDRAREAARAADAALAAGETKPLLGVPMTVKESNDVAGLPTTWGLEAHAGYIPDADGPPIARLKNAGVVILGKTNVPPMLADWQANNPVYGRTNNPHDLERVPGGSSGGAAAALAAGMVPLEFGSDIGGSIRVPAHYCGVYGHKPSYGAITLEGHGFPGTDGADLPLAVVGPLARNCADIALALDIVSDIALPRPRKQALSECRLLVVTDAAFAVEDAIAAAVENRAAACERAGATVDRRSDLLPDLGALHAQYVGMLLTVLAVRDPSMGVDMPKLPAWFDMLDAQARCRRQWRALFEDYDAVLAPVAGTTAFPHDPKGMDGRMLTIGGEEVPFGAQFGWIGIATYPGLPAISAPIGEDAAGLPIGLQIIGGYHQDHQVIELAKLIGELG